MTTHMLKLVLCVCMALVAQLAQSDPRESETSIGFDDGDLNTQSLVHTKRGYSLDLEHSISIDGAVGGFSSRGEVAIDFERARPTVTFPNKVVLNDAQRAAFQKLSSQNGFYTVRARSQPGNPKSAYVMASVPVCFLVKNRFREDFSFHVNDVGHLISIEFRTPSISPAECASVGKRVIKDASFSSTGSVAVPIDGPEVPRIIAASTAAKVAIPPGVQPVRDENAPPAEESQSFFRKYWYIIVPVLVFLVSSGGDAAPAAAGATPVAGGRR